MALLPLAAVDTLGLSAVPLWHGVEKATQSWVMGALLVDSSGVVAVGAADPALGTILGVATGAATGVTGADVNFVPALSSIIFEGNLDDGSGTLALVQATHMWARFGLDVTSGKFWLDSTDTTNIRTCVVGFRDPVGTLNGRVYFVFLPDASRFTFTAV